MTEPFQHPISRGGAMPARRGDSLADVLERVLDKGIVIAGDIRVDLLDIELLTIRIRLLISSADKAQELGMAWWRNDPFFTGELPADAEDGQEIGEGETGALQRLVEGTEELSRRVAELEAQSQEASEPRGSSTQGGEANKPDADPSGVEESRPGGAE